MFLETRTSKTRIQDLSRKSKYQLQFMEEIEGAEGVQLVIHKVSVPDILAIGLWENLAKM